MMKIWIRDWWRGYSDADKLNAGQKLRHAWGEFMRETGWRRADDDFPPTDEPILTRRYEWDSSAVMVMAEMPPEMNIVGLWWKPVNGALIEQESSYPIIITEKT